MSDNINLHILLGTKRLIPFEETLKQEFDKAIPLITSKLPVTDVDIIVSDNPDNAIPEQGIGGYSPDANTIYVSLDPTFENLKESLQKEFKRTLAHELHHSMRWRNPGYGENLLDAMISEGLADHFDLEVYGENLQPWSSALDENQISELKKKAESEYANSEYDHMAWFYGSEEMGIPRWSGYALGFKLVRDFLEKNPDKKASTLYSEPTDSFR
jgi:uncharacterized protein YjaZ